MRRGGHVPSRTNQYLKSHFSESIRFNVYDRIPETSANQWLQMATDFGTMEVPRCPLHPRLRAPLMQASFPLSFRKKWRKPRHKYLNTSFHFMSQIQAQCSPTKSLLSRKRAKGFSDCWLKHDRSLRLMKQC